MFKSCGFRARSCAKPLIVRAYLAIGKNLNSDLRFKKAREAIRHDRYTASPSRRVARGEREAWRAGRLPPSAVSATADATVSGERAR
eukprot:5965699-Pleurochrysis_carterae.AAC.1